MQRLPVAKLVGILLWLAAVGAADDQPHRWLYLQQNLQVSENIPQVEALLRRAKAAGIEWSFIT